MVNFDRFLARTLVVAALLYGAVAALTARHHPLGSAGVALVCAAAVACAARLALCTECRGLRRASRRVWVVDGRRTRVCDECHLRLVHKSGRRFARLIRAAR